MSMNPGSLVFENMQNNKSKVLWIRFDRLMFKVHIQCRTKFPIFGLHFRVLSSVNSDCLSF